MTVRELLTKWSFSVDTKQILKAETSFKTLQNRVSVGVSKMQQNMRQFNNQLGKMDKELSKVSGGATKIFAGTGAVLVGAVAGATKSYDNITHALTMTNLEGKELEETQEKMLANTVKLSNALNISSSEVSDSYYNVLSTGVEILSDEFNALTESSLRFGKVAKMDTPQAISSLADTANAFGISLKDAEVVANALFLTSKQANTNIPLLVESMKNVGATAGGLGISINETSAVLGSFANAGLKGAEAGTALRGVISKLGSPNGVAKKTLDSLGVSMYDVEGNTKSLIDFFGELQIATKKMTAEQKASTFKQLGGEEGMNALNILMGANIDKMRAWRDETENAGNAIDKAFRIKMMSPLEMFKKFWNTIVNIGISIGRVVMVAQPLFSILTDILGTISEFITENQTLGIVLGVILGAITVATGAIAGLAVGIKIATGVMATFGVVSYIALAKFIAIGALVVGAIALISLVANELYGFFTGKFDTFLGKWFEEWKVGFAMIVDTVKGWVSVVVGKFWEFIDLMKVGFDKFKQILSSPWDFFMASALKAFNFIQKKYMAFIKPLAGFGSKLLSKIGIDFDIAGLMQQGSDNINAFAQAKSADLFQWDSDKKAMSVTSGGANTTTNDNRQISISVDGSQSPEQTAQAIQYALQNENYKTIENFRTGVAY